MPRNVGYHHPGFYGIVGPNWNGTLPRDPSRGRADNFTNVFRADKDSPQGQDMSQEAETFRRHVLAQGLSVLQHPGVGVTVIKPERDGFDFPFKTFAD